MLPSTPKSQFINPTNNQLMRTFLSLSAAYIAAGIFAVLCVQSATFQTTHSGTQNYVRVIR